MASSWKPSRPRQEALAREGFAEIGKLEVRMVVVTGEADERDGDYFGPVLNEAAIMLEACEAGRLLASAVTRAVVGNALPTGVKWLRMEHKEMPSHRADESPYEIIRTRP